jgi:transglutaminase-like putative cysteine protease
MVELAHDWAAGSITYRVGVTGTQTPAALALHLGQGVCQDYAHIMLALLRCLGIPARYVSGHLIGEGAPHAWVEVLPVDSSSDQSTALLAFDPTHHRRVGHNYISVAVGRDFADVTSTSGVFSGAATGKLHWSKQAEAIEPPVSAHAEGAAA